MHFIRLFAVLSLVSFRLSAAPSEILTGQVYRKDSGRKELLFNYKSVTTEQGALKKVEAQFTDLQGQPVVRETSERNGARLVRYEMDHVQTGRKGSITVSGNKITFNFEDNGQKKKTETEDLPDYFVVGHTLIPFLSEHWKQIQDGQTLEVRFGVWDRRETVGFSLFKVGQENLDGREVVLVKFKPTSFLIAALVDPVIFKVTTDGKMLAGMIGRVAPKRKDGSRWKDLDAEVVYKSATE